jgi:hypothetical protein
MNCQVLACDAPFSEHNILDARFILEPHMSEKSNSPKRKTKKPPRSAPAVARTKSSPSRPVPVFYMTFAEMSVAITKTSPRAAAGARQFATFDEAKSAAIEALIEAVERAERQLVVLKHANRCDELTSDP